MTWACGSRRRSSRRSAARWSTPATCSPTPKGSCAPCAGRWTCRSTPRCCPGRRARGTATACGLRTGTTACTPRPASRPTGPRRSPCRPGSNRWPTAACRTTSGSISTGSAMLQSYDERNRDLIVNVGGTLTHRDQAGVSPFDSVVQGGDAVWEGLRLYAGRIFRLDEHLARLRNSAKALAFDQIPSADLITEEIRRTLAANGMRDGVHIRLTLTRGVKVTSGMDPRLNQAGPTLIVLAEYKDPVYDAS